MSTQPQVEGGRGPLRTSHPPTANSLLVADCGTVFTKVSLFGLVEGQYRLMARGEAPTTIAPPYEDVTKGIIQAINIIEFITGRHFISEGHILSPEQPIGDGVDVFITTMSGAGPLRLVVLGAVDATIEELTRQAVSGLYADVQAQPTPSFVAVSAPVPLPVGAQLNTSLQSSSAWTPERVALEWERQLERIRELQPQAALIVGMANGPAGPAPLQEACQLLINASRERNERYGDRMSAGSVARDASIGVASNDVSAPPISVLYAGDPQYVEAVRGMLQEVAEVTHTDPLVSPEQMGTISKAVGELYERDVIQQVPGYERLRSWSTAQPMPTATSLSSLVRFLAQHYAMNVTAVDVGGATTTLMQAGEGGEFIPMLNSGIGVGPGMGAILQKAGIQRIARWLPFDTNEDELRQFTLNCMLHPHVLPTTHRDLQITHAFAREAIILSMEEAQRRKFDWLYSDLILATGGVLSHAPKYGQAALILLDALQPKGVTSLVLDRTMLISQLGAMATVAPIAAVQVNENDAVTHRLGTCVIPFGELPQGGIALRVDIDYTSGRHVSVDVMSGTIEVIPLQTGEQAYLSLFPAPTVDVGLGPGERAKAAEEIDGGLIGLIIDARGRPLAFPTNEKERQARLLQWMQSIGA